MAETCKECGKTLVPPRPRPYGLAICKLCEEVIRPDGKCRCVWEQEIHALQAIVDKLPKCCRLDDNGKLVQDKVVVPGMLLFFYSEDGELYQEEASSDPLPGWEQTVSDCYDSAEAAKEKADGH